MGSHGGTHKARRTQRLAPLALLLALAVLALGKTAFAEGEQPGDPRAAIIIDDFGNGMKGTEEMLKLPMPITVAVMPFLSTTKQDAETAYKAGYEVIVHMPMEPKRGKASWLGPGAIRSSMTDAEIRETVEKAIDDVPHAIGMNNHMGSKVTSDPRIMRIVMEVCASRHLFFVDSHTDPRTVAGAMAKQLGVPTIDNELFLDDIQTPVHVMKQLNRVKRKAEEKGTCVAIGHVGVGGLVTADALKKTAESSTPSTVRFVKITSLLPLQQLY